MTLGDLLANKKLVAICTIVAVGLISLMITVLFLKIKTPVKPPVVQIRNYVGSVHFLAKEVDLANVPSEKTIDLIIDPAGGSLAGASIGLQYDPKFVEVTHFNLNNTEGSLFGKEVKIAELRTNFDQTDKTSIVLILPSNVAEGKGRGTIGSITFKFKNLVPGSTTQIGFNNETNLITRVAGTNFVLDKTPLMVRMSGSAK